MVRFSKFAPWRGDDLVFQTQLGSPRGRCWDVSILQAAWWCLLGDFVEKKHGKKLRKKKATLHQWHLWLCAFKICMPLWHPFRRVDSQGFFLVRYGLPRCILACMHAEAASNQHLRVQNPNLDIEGGLWAPHPSALGGSQVSDRNYISDCAELWKGWYGCFPDSSYQISVCLEPTFVFLPSGNLT